MTLMNELSSLEIASNANQNNRMMFRMWQAGRELFHSNMFAFLLEDVNYGPIVANVLADNKIISVSNGAPTHEVRVLREAYRLDLIVLIRPKSIKGPCYVIAVENKFKSIPDIGQLAHYDETLDEHFPQGAPNNTKSKKSFDRLWQFWETGAHDGNKQNEDEPDTGSGAPAKTTTCNCTSVILLKTVLVPTNNIFSGYSNWKSVTYKAVYKAMGKSLTPCALNGYVQITQATICVIDALWSDLATVAFSSFDAAALKMKTRHLRLNDLVEKYRYEWLRSSWIKKMLTQPSVVQALPEGMKFPKDRKSYNRIGQFQQNGCKIVVEVYSDFSNGAGLAGVELFPIVGNDPLPFSFGLQLQDGHLKVHVCFGDAKVGRNRDECRAAAMLIQICKALRIAPDCFSGLTQKPPGRKATTCAGLEIAWVAAPNHGLCSYHQKIRQLKDANGVVESVDGWFFYVKAPVWGAVSKESVCASLNWPEKKLDKLAQELATLTVRLLNCGLVTDLGKAFSPVTSDHK